MANVTDETIQKILDEKRAAIKDVQIAIDAIKEYVSIRNPLFDELRQSYKNLHAAKVTLEIDLATDIKYLS